jgi:hypothetical protein
VLVKANSITNATTLNVADITSNEGIDLEPDEVGATYHNANVWIEGNTFSGNKNRCIAIAGPTTTSRDIHVLNNDFICTGTQQGVDLNAIIYDLCVSGNTFYGGAYGFTASNGNEVMQNVSVLQNKFLNQTAEGITIADNVDGNMTMWDIAHNTFTGSYVLVNIVPSNSRPYEFVVHDNQYHSTGDLMDADDACVVIKNCYVYNEIFQRRGTLTNRYAIEIDSAGPTLSGRISMNPLKLVLKDTAVNNIEALAGVGEIDKVLGDKQIVWYGTAAPGAGTWAVGARVIHTDPASAGKTDFVCVSAGTSGTWQGATLS